MEEMVSRPFGCRRRCARTTAGEQPVRKNVRAQQTARDWIRSAWQGLPHETVEDAICDTQEDAAADFLARSLWPALPVDDIVRLDSADRSLLHRGPAVVPDGFAVRLRDRLVEAAKDRIAAALPGNKHARGGRLLEIVRQEVTSGTNIERTIEWAFRERDNDDFTRLQSLREKVLKRLSTLAAKELASLSEVDPDAEPKRKLKILTALGTPGGTRESRVTIGQFLEGHNPEGFGLPPPTTPRTVYGQVSRA
jgi:hypothetical protein